LLKKRIKQKISNPDFFSLTVEVEQVLNEKIHFQNHSNIRKFSFLHLEMKNVLVLHRVKSTNEKSLKRKLQKVKEPSSKQ
jgi:hypothetical protein